MCHRTKVCVCCQPICMNNSIKNANKGKKIPVNMSSVRNKQIFIRQIRVNSK